MPPSLTEQRLMTFLELKLRAESIALEVLEFAQTAWEAAPEYRDILEECEKVHAEAVADRRKAQELLRCFREPNSRSSAGRLN